MHVPVGPTVAADSILSQRNAGDPDLFLAVVVQLHGLRDARKPFGRITQAEGFHHSHPVRRDLEASPHLAEDRRLLEETHTRIPLAERNRCRESANPAAHHGDRSPLQPHACLRPQV